MAQVLCVANQKGGVGKTTSALSLSAYAALSGRRTLLIDLDSQGNSSSVLCHDMAELPEGLSLMEGIDPIPSDRANLWVLPCNGVVDPSLNQQGITESISRISEQFDTVVLDCPPTLVGVATAALWAADDVVIPIQSEYYALEGLGQILGLVASLREDGLSHNVSIRILLCMYDEELRLCRDVVTEVQKHLGEQVLKTVIPRDVALATAPSHRQTIIEHQPLSPGSLAYCAAAKELLHV